VESVGNSVVEPVLSTHKALGSISSTKKLKINKVPSVCQMFCEIWKIKHVFHKYVLLLMAIL
jgi:hypothetical protein